MAITFSQTNSNNTTGNSVTCAFTSNPTAGNGLIVFFGCTNATATVSSLSDTLSNSFTLITTQTGNGYSSFAYYVKSNNTTAADTVSVSVNSAGGFLDLQIYEIGPGAGNNQITSDQVVGVTSSTNTTSVTFGPTGTLANSQEFAVAFAIVTGTMASNGSGYTFNATSAGNFGEYLINSGSTTALTATGVQSPAGKYTGMFVTFYGQAGGTTVNATVAIKAKAVSGLVANPQVIKDAIFLCAAGVHATNFKCDLGVFGHDIILGKATLTSTGQVLIQRATNILGKAAATFSPFITHNATAAIVGSAGNTRFNGLSNPTFVNATVHLFGFAANQTPIDQFFGRATLRLLSTVPQPLITINGRATLTPNVQVIRNNPTLFAGHARLALTGLVTGQGLVSGSLLIFGRAAFTTLSPKIIRNAQVVIEAGNPFFTVVVGEVGFLGRANLSSGVFLTHNASVLIAGRASLKPVVTLTGTNNIYSGVHFAGRATGTFAILPQAVLGTANVSAKATGTFTAQVLVAINATVAIKGRARAPFMAFVVGGFYNNGVVTVLGKAVLTASAFRLVLPTVNLMGLANLHLYPGDTIRAGLVLKGFAKFTPQVPKQLLQWSSANTLQYKVWQYNSEQMVRVLGSTWTTTSVGLTFQSVAMEVVSTEAGWGS